MAKRKNLEDVKRQIYSKVGDEYSLIGEYKTMHEKTLFLHNTCGNEYYTRPHDFINKGQRCPYCLKHRKLSQYISKLKRILPSDYKILNEKGISSSSDNLEVYHFGCNKIWITKMSYVLSGSKCYHCFGNSRKTQKEFEEEVYNVLGRDYIVKSDYEGYSKKVSIEHVKCGKQYRVRAGSALDGSGCYNCFGNKRKNTSDFKREVCNLEGGKYTVLEDYHNARTKIKMRHNLCGNEWSITPDQFLRGRRCPECKYLRIGSAKPKKSHSMFVRQVNDKSGGEYTVLGVYKKWDEEILMKHNTCKNEWYIAPTRFLGGARCPECSISSGESIIVESLRSHGLNVDREFTFNDCIYKYPLRFDIKIKDYNLIFEYDGEQHFFPVEFWGGEDSHNDRVRNDKIKNKYCIDNGFNLIRIPYIEKDHISSIVFCVLFQLGIIEDTSFDKSINEYIVDGNWDHDEYIRRVTYE